VRYLIFRICIYLGLAFLLGGLFHTQVIQGQYYMELGDKNRMRLIPVEAPRGRVFDRNGNLLATNRPAYDIVATPEDVTPDVIKTLSAMLTLSNEEIKKRLRSPREYPFAPAVISEDISQELAFKIEEMRPDLAGVEIRVSGLRFYPYGETAAHIIGFIGKINKQEYLDHEEKGRYGFNSMIGRAGLEKLYDEELRGWRGGRQIEVNAQGKLVRVLSEKNPDPGKDLIVTVDLEFQKRIMELLKDHHASVAVLDIKTSELIAMASTPSFDPNVFVAPGLESKRLSFIKDKEAPMLDRGISSSYPPGSIFKLVTALAALETGKITPGTHFFCSGQFRLKPGTSPRKCWYAQGHGNLNLYEAIERSCNVYFYNLGKLLTADEIAHYARELGLGKEMEIETTNISPGLVPDSAWKKSHFKEKWYQGETLSFAIGQSYLLTSPLQILRLVATIASGGRSIEPRLLRDPSIPPDTSRVAITKAHIEIVKKGMLQVVQSDYGTGQLARLDFGTMAAKTGTAQAPPLNSHAWMTGFFPYEDPEIAFVVFVEHGGSGGIAAAGIVKGTFEIWKEMYGPKVA